MLNKVSWIGKYRPRMFSGLDQGPSTVDAEVEAIA